MNKKYYWFKMPDNFFEQNDIKIIIAQKNGNEYVRIWIKMCLEAVSQKEGRRRVDSPATKRGGKQCEYQTRRCGRGP